MSIQNKIKYFLFKTIGFYFKVSQDLDLSCCDGDYGGGERACEQIGTNR